MKFCWKAMLVLFLLTGSVQLIAKSYEIPRIETEVFIDRDGQVRVVEELTYRFEGTFSWAYYRLPKKGYSDITDIRISENGKEFSESESEEKGNFSVSGDSESIVIKWHYEAEDEERTFRLSYRLKEALTIGPEWSQFFWNVISSHREKPTDSLLVFIHYPGELRPDSLYTWFRGPEGQIVLDQSKDRVFLRANDLGADEYLKVRTVFPSRLLSQVHSKVNDPDFSLSWARADEARHRKEMEDLRKQRLELIEDSRIINASIALLSLFAFLYLYRRYGKRHPSSRWSTVQTVVPPDDSLPAAIGWLMSGRSVTSNHLLATVLDLARKGFFKLEERPPAGSITNKKDSRFRIDRTEKEGGDELTGWEREVIQFVDRRLNDGDHDLQEVFSSRTAEVRRWFSNWKSNLKSYCIDQDWIDQNSYTGAYWNAGIQSVLLLVLLGSSISYTGFVDPAGTLITIAIVMAAAFLSFLILRRTEKGEEAYHRWNNYKKGLQEAGEHTFSKGSLDSHFIYAVALGLDKDGIEALCRAYAEPFPVFAWLIAVDSSPDAVTGTLSTLSASGSSAFVGTSVGTGASAGTAGGGASAGAG